MAWGRTGAIVGQQAQVCRLGPRLQRGVSLLTRHPHALHVHKQLRYMRLGHWTNGAGLQPPEDRFVFQEVTGDASATVPLNALPKKDAAWQRPHEHQLAVAAVKTAHAWAGLRDAAWQVQGWGN